MTHLEYAAYASLMLGTEIVIDTGKDSIIRANLRGASKVSTRFTLFYYCHTLSNHFSTCTGNTIYCCRYCNFILASVADIRRL